MIPAAALWVSLASAQEAEPKFPGPELPGPSELFAPDIVELSRERYIRATRLHRTGNILAIGGAVATAPALFITISGAFAGNEAVAATGAVLFFGSAGAAIAGTAMSNIGARNATMAVADGTGWSPDFTYSTASWVVLGAGLVSAPFTSAIGAYVGVVGSVALSALQLSTARRVLVDRRLILVPTGNGLMVAGRF